jgi:hypothetical protein
MDVIRKRKKQHPTPTRFTILIWGIPGKKSVAFSDIFVIFLNGAASTTFLRDLVVEIIKVAFSTAVKFLP